MERFENSLPDNAEHDNNACGGAPSFRVADYWHYLDAMDLTDTEKTALLETLWGIIAGFVQLGFGVDPVQTVIPALVQSALTESGAHGNDQEAQCRFNGAAQSDQEETNEPE